MRFLVYYTTSEAWIPGKTTNEQPFVSQHALFIQNGFNAGKFVLAGPFEDHSGGASFIEVANEEEAHELINSDPFIINNVVTAKISPWEPIYDAYEKKSPGFTKEFFESQGINMD